MRSVAVILLLLWLCPVVYAQTALSLDSTKAAPIPLKFLTDVSSKATSYYNSVESKTEKTLERLAKWEQKIKTILEKVSPSTAAKLFSNKAITFADVLEKYKKGKLVADNAVGRYDEYRDKITTSLQYIKTVTNDSTKITAASSASSKMQQLNAALKNTEAVQQFIKERKKQLQQQAMQFMANSKYIKKINKDSYYYAQALVNYKETFSDPKKTEALAMRILEKIPAFNSFLRKNSMLASLFRVPGDPMDAVSLSGLQTRAQVNNLIQQQLASGGPNAQAQFQQNLQEAQSQLQNLKNKILKNGGSSSEDIMPEGFKPNNQKTKSLKDRLEYGTNIQTQSATSFFPVTSDLGLSLGYKLNDKSVIGIGASYKLGFGRGWDHIRFSQEGAGLRSYIDWKIKGNFWISGGYEMNYKSTLQDIVITSPSGGGRKGDSWQQSGLIGLSKSIPLKTKFFKKTKMQLLWDFLSYQQVPRTQSVLFRVGYNF